MVLLKKSIFILALTIAIHTQAQDYKAMQEAFTKSYTSETGKKYDDAIQQIKQVYAANNYEINLRLGWLNYLNAKYADAATYYQIAITLQPNATEPLWGIINPLAAQERWNDVQKKYLAILKLDAKNSLANYRLGLTYYYAQDYVNAKKYFDVSYSLYPTDTDVLLMSGWTNYYLGKTAEAKVLFNKVLLLKPTDTSAVDGLKLLK